MQAHCQCGQLSAVAHGEYSSVVCHCTTCQRRSGSPFGMALYFDAAKVTISGKATEYERTADSGLPFTSGFCPVCGTTLYLKTARHPGGIGITAGTLVGEPIGPPMRSVFEENRHDWVTLPPETARFPRGRNDK